MRHGISTNNILKCAIAKIKIGAGVWEHPEANSRVSIENGRMLDVVRI
jgi:hypothetical protein